MKKHCHIAHQFVSNDSTIQQIYNVYIKKPHLQQVIICIQTYSQTTRLDSHERVHYWFENLIRWSADERLHVKWQVIMSCLEKRSRTYCLAKQTQFKDGQRIQICISKQMNCSCGECNCCNLTSPHSFCCINENVFKPTVPMQL